MRLHPLLRSLLLAFAALVLTAPAHADTYQIFTLDSDEARYFRGMDADGTVIFSYGTTNPTCDVQDCFHIYTDGTLAWKANTLPTIIADNGTACTPSVPAGATITKGICNNGYEAWIGYLTPGQGKPFLYTGTDPSSALPGQTDVFLYMNSNGDIVWNDANREVWLEAIDLTSHSPSDPAPVPEPGSLALLATGALAAATTLRRRLHL